MKVRLIYICLFILSALSCVREEASVLSDDGSVLVSLDVTVDGLDAVTKSTDISVIKNLWVIQYDGTDDTALLHGQPIYIEDFPSFYEGNKELRLMPTKGEREGLVVFLANTFDEGLEPPQNTTVLNLKERYVSIQSSDDLIPNGVECPIFSGCFLGKISTSVEIAVELKRNIAKVDISLENANGSGVTITSVELCSVPDKSYYFVNYDGLTAPFPTLKNFESLELEQLDWIVSRETESSKVMDLPTMYLPVNRRGISTNVSEAYKSDYAPDGATYLSVTGYYVEAGRNIPVYYKFYLGENMYNDYNINPNKHYKYTFTIRSKGDADNDSRLEDMGLVDFTSPRYELANSYILNPSPSGKRNFRIPIQRVFTFWGSDSYAYYEDDKELSFRTSDSAKKGKWRALVLKSDFEITESNFKFVKGAGTAPADSYFEVEVAKEVEGNVLVAVGPDDGSGRISWSWHLWITDYDPYEALNWGDGVDGKYVYKVKNGNVHRYEGDFWKNNKEQYIMDRNLGWTSEAHLYPEDNKGLLYYQFGRKDPFIYAAGYTSVDYNTANAVDAVLYSVQNPTVFIKSSDKDWTSGNKYNPTEYEKGIIWNDFTTVATHINYGQKSIFDPCPPGYKVPDRSIWSDFRVHSSDTRTTNSFPESYFNTGDVVKPELYKGGFQPYNSVKGLQYWPFQGDGVLIPDQAGVVYIPASGFLYPGSGGLSNHGNTKVNNVIGSSEMWSFLWAENPASLIQGAGYTSQINHLKNSNETWRSRGLPVRCITDK